MDKNKLIEHNVVFFNYSPKPMIKLSPLIRLHYVH